MIIEFLGFVSFGSQKRRCSIDCYRHGKNKNDYALPTKNRSLKAKMRKKKKIPTPTHLQDLFLYSQAGFILSTHLLQGAKCFSFSRYYYLPASFLFSNPFSFLCLTEVPPAQHLPPLGLCLSHMSAAGFILSCVSSTCSKLSVFLGSTTSVSLFTFPAFPAGN